MGLVGIFRIHAAHWALAAATALATPTVAQEACSAGDCPGAGAEKAVRVGYSQFPPFSRTNQAGVAEGYSIELIRLLLEPSGYSITFVPFANPADMLAALERREISLTSILGDNPARRAIGDFTDYVASFEIRVFSADTGPGIETAEDLIGLKVGASDGSIGYRLISEVDGVNVITLGSSANVLLPLLSGEVDAIAGSTQSLRYLANRAGLSHRLVATDVILRQTPAALLVDPSADVLLADLNAAIAAANEAGHLEELHEDWFGQRAAPFTFRERTVVAAAILAALAVFGYWVRLHYIVLKRARRLEARAQLLSETLDATGLSLAIFDVETRPVYWNEPYKESFPKQVPLLRKGLDMETLIAAAHRNGSVGETLPPEDAERTARERVELLKAGGEHTSINQLSSGKSVRSSMLMLPNGQFATIASDVTELVDAQTSLEHARADLEAANQRLAEFNRIAAHDLIAPLRNVRNLHNWIRDDFWELGVELDEETVQNFESIDMLLQRQTKMIEDLLAYSSPGSIQKPEAFDPVERFGAVLELSNVPAGFRILLPSRLPQLMANPIAFDIVLRNLISNAVKHHDRKMGIIEIAAVVGPTHCTFEVRDDGPGIPENALERIFEPFTRLKSRDDGAGSGLGLAFIKRRVEEWGGKVEAVSKDGQRGTLFRFDVPLAMPETEAAQQQIAS